MTFAIESRMKIVARMRVTSKSVFSKPRRVRKTAESLPKVDPSPLVLDCMRMITIRSTDSRIWAACRYGAKSCLLPISVTAGDRVPIIAYDGGAGWTSGPPFLPRLGIALTRVEVLTKREARFHSVAMERLRGLRSSYLCPSG